MGLSLSIDLRGDKHVSYLNLPRIYFGGNWTGNVATGNNQPFLFYSDTGGKTQQVEVLDFANAAIRPVKINGQSPTDAQLRQLMNDEDIAKPNQAPLDQGANWCYWGTNTASFATSITGVNLGQGFSANDPLVKQPAAFLHAELCDTNPAGSQSTQMFFDAFNLAGVQLDAPRAFSRWVWFFRNRDMRGSAGASGVFETVLPVSADQWKALLATNSPAIKALHAAWQAAGSKAAGLSVRYGLFASTSENAGPTVNRVGLVSGAIGIATTDELASFPNCRTLYNDFQPRPFGPVLLAVDRVGKQVSVDLFSALPESGATRDTVSKRDVGKLSLWLNTDSGSVLVGTIDQSQYAIANVTQQGSIVDVSYAANAAAVEKALDAGGNFTITSDSIANNNVFAEDYWAASDERDYYLENGQSGSIQIKVMKNGKPAANTTVNLQQFAINYADDSADVGGDSPTPSTAWVCDMPATVTTDASGKATIPLKAKKTGNTVIRYTLGNDQDAVNVLRDGFTNIRVLPNDDYSKIPDPALLGQAGFKIVYDNVLRYFYITFPVMQPIMDFSNYEVMTTPQLLKMLQTVTDPSRWWGYGYMPRSRDLSASRRDLLVRWANVNLKALSAPAQPVA